jgi:hypothetical protein
MPETSFSSHALDAWKQRAQLLGLNPSPNALRHTFMRASRETPKNPTQSFELLKREVMKGGIFYVADGWRFVVNNDVVITVERVKPNENYHSVKTKRGYCS